MNGCYEGERDQQPPGKCILDAFIVVPHVYCEKSALKCAHCSKKIKCV